MQLNLCTICDTNIIDVLFSLPYANLNNRLMSVKNHALVSMQQILFNYDELGNQYAFAKVN